MEVKLKSQEGQKQKAVSENSQKHFYCLDAIFSCNETS